MADLDDLLLKTSRTFALSIPLLPEPTRREVTIAYLLFRIADTFEDASAWPAAKRIEALDTFDALLETPRDPAVAEAAARWHREVPEEHDGYRELLGEIPGVLDAFAALDDAARDLVREHTQRTARGMAGYVDRTIDGHLALDTLQELRDYCYVVAGIVGEMLTELFLLDRPELSPVKDALRSRARLAGEAQQLVNILKDSAADAVEGRSYLPGDTDRDEVFALARADLEAAGEYVMLLQNAGTDRGLVEFNALPVLLAFAALDAVERKGAGAKISRIQVYRIKSRMERALDRGEPVIATAPRRSLDQPEPTSR